MMVKCSRRAVPGILSSSAVLALLASAWLAAGAALAQGAATNLPDTMRPPPLRGDILPGGPADGRVGDPLPAALLLVPEAAPPSVQPAQAQDGAVGDLIGPVSRMPATRPSRTEMDGQAGDLVPGVANVPSPRPAQPAGDDGDGDLLAYVPRVPTSRPDGNKILDAAIAPGAARQSPMEMTVEEKQCRQKLAAAGARFREHERLADASGCLVPFPIVLTALGSGVGLEPEAVLNCQAALALAEYARDTVSPEATERFGAALKTVNHASAYVCRGRVGTGESKLSEHAFGNAIDIGSFELIGGRSIEVRAYGPGEAVERDFMRDVRGAACGPWKTVLGPGTNAEHATHFHLDLAQRRRGGTYCK